MVTAGVARHIITFRHMALHTASAHTTLRARGMGSHINNGRGGTVYRRARSMATQAKRIILLRHLQGGSMGVVAIQTSYTGSSHAAQAQPGLAIIFIALHAVGPKYPLLRG